MKLLIILATLLSLLIVFCSCGVASESSSSMAFETMLAETNVPIIVPSRAENIKYNVTNLDDNHRASEVTCILDGDELQILACKVEPEFSAERVSPLLREYWSFSGNPTINGYYAIVKATTDGTGYIIWKDDSNILHSISILKNTSHLAHENLAVEVSASEKLVQLGEELSLGLNTR